MLSCFMFGRGGLISAKLLRMGTALTAPLVKRTCAGIAEITCPKEPPQVFRNSGEQIADIAGSNRNLAWPPDTDHASDKAQNDDDT